MPEFCVACGKYHAYKLGMCWQCETEYRKHELDFMETNMNARDYEVSMKRKETMNPFENSRMRMGYVRAENEFGAKKEAERKYPAFYAVSARKVS